MRIAIVTFTRGTAVSRFDPPITAVRRLVEWALVEDLEPLGDVSAHLLPASLEATCEFRSREFGVFAGRACVAETFRQVDDAVSVEWMVADGDALAEGDTIVRVTGSTQSLLIAERVSLNFACHLSGIATMTRAFVLAAGHRLSIRDTRKTLPGLRALQKAAVRAGGGTNHRGSLSESFMMKDNHLSSSWVRSLFAAAAEQGGGRLTTVECDTAGDVRAAVVERPQCVLLDNMTPDEVRAVVELVPEDIDIEVSGNIDLSNISAYAEIPQVRYAAIGALTHSARSLDIGADYVQSLQLARSGA
jgi:nicotinate-nucleotide pyrophosphorylase (carboxylating)